jgi:YgiT-type zinc finger domain-containing protein
MKCVVCKKGETAQGKVTVTLERGDMTLVIKRVPAHICENCGEEYVDETITTKLLKTAEEAARMGIHVDIRNYQLA